MKKKRKKQHEAMLVVNGKHGWLCTATFRHGGKDSPVGVDSGVCDTALPRQYRLASVKCTRPCVLLSTSAVCALDTPTQCWVMAQWLIAASLAMQSEIERREEGK